MHNHREEGVFFMCRLMHKNVSSKFFEESSVRALSALDKLKEARMDISNVQEILRSACIPR